jgi:ribosomal-protein-alanine N-acetyltransferase
LLIRPATTADIPAMMAMASQSPTAAQWPIEQYQQAIHAQQPRRIALVSEESNLIVAFLIARSVIHEWELENIVTAPAVRGRGLASQILNEFVAIAKREKSESIFLEVREYNLSARAFYEKWAFEKSGRRINYYSDPKEDAIVYRLSLV